MNIAVFDTETAGVKTQTLLNVGYQIVCVNPQTLAYTALCKRDYLVRDVFNNKLFMLNDKFVGAEKYEQFEENLVRGGTILRSVKQIFAQMASDFARYKIEAAYAYNSDFDVDKFSTTANLYGEPNPLDGIPVFDLWGMAFNFICDAEYQKWCVENEMLTESKRFWKTSVESVTAYLTNNPSFIEEHTALSDTEWELKILIECLKRGANPFGNYAHGFLPSGYVFKKTLLINGKPIEISYTKMSGKFDKDAVIEFT